MVSSKASKASSLILILALVVGVFGWGLTPLPAAASDPARAPEPAAPQVAEEPLTIAILTNGPISDTGWSYQLDQAGKAFQETFGERVEVRVAESVPYGEEAARTIELFIAEGADVIIEGVYSVETVDPVIEAHPEVKFIVFGTTLTAPNAQWVWWNQGQFQYLLGMAAGLLTKSDKLGYIAPWDNPMMRTEINGYHMGARSVNPDVTTYVVSLNSWYDPAGARQATEALISSGVDVIGGDMDDPTKVVVAEEKGVWAMGAYSNRQKDFAPNAYVNSYVYDFAKMFTPLIQGIFDDTWLGDSKLVWYELGTGVDIGEWGDKVPQDVIDQVMAAHDKMVSKEFDPFVGPITDKNGNIVLADGETWTPEEWVAGFKWTLEGVEGIPATLP